MMTATDRGRAPATELVLSDGRTVLVRRLDAHDAAALVDAVAHADATSLRRRFLGAPPPMRVLVDRLVKADGVDDLPLGAFDQDGRLVAVAQYDRLGQTPVAELAMEVAKDWQEVGLGSHLVELLATAACEAGIRTFTATFFADNSSVTKLLREAPCPVRIWYEQGQGYADLDITQSCAPA